MRPETRTRGVVAHDGGMVVKNDVHVSSGSGAPSNGTSGTGVGSAGPGSLYVDIANGKWYSNTNTMASPTWTVVGAQS